MTILQMQERVGRVGRLVLRRVTFCSVLTVLLIAFSSPLPLHSAAFAQGEADARPYDEKLLKLSELLGAIHYLRELCGADEGQLWRNQMRDLIDSEGSTALRRLRFVKRFNKGYRGYRRTYRNCTASAKIAISRFMAEGEKLSEKLVEENK